MVKKETGYSETHMLYRISISFLLKCQSLFYRLPLLWLQNNAHKPAIVIIHDFLHRILQFLLAFLIHHRNLPPDTIFHQFTQ